MAIMNMRPPKPPARDGLLTPEDAAEILQISPGTLKHWVAWRKIEHVKIGKNTTRFTRAALDRFIQQQTVTAVEEA